MPCEISDYLSYYNASLTPVALANQQILAVPQADYLRIKVSSAFRLLAVNPQVTSAALRYGIVATTDSGGAWSLTLPYGDADESHPSSPEPRWSIVFPDGRVASGVVPSVAGPLNVDTLITTYGWTLNTSVYVAPTTQGQLARGTAVFDDAESAVVLLEPPFASSAYVIKLTPSVDENGEVPDVAYDDKTTTGFTIRAAGVGTFTCDWEAVL